MEEDEEQEERQIKMTGNQQSQSRADLWLCVPDSDQQSFLFSPSCQLLLTSTCCIVLFHLLCLCELHLSSSSSSLSLFILTSSHLRQTCVYVLLFEQIYSLFETMVEIYNCNSLVPVIRWSYIQL